MATEFRRLKEVNPIIHKVKRVRGVAAGGGKRGGLKNGPRLIDAERGVSGWGK